MAHSEENVENRLAVTRPVPPAPSVLTNWGPQRSPSGNQVTPRLVRTTQPSAALARVRLARPPQTSAAREMWPGQGLFTCGSENIRKPSELHPISYFSGTATEQWCPGTQNFWLSVKTRFYSSPSVPRFYSSRSYRGLPRQH